MKNTDIGRIKWKCRRGMLELDLILSHFCEHHYGDLTPEQQKTFEILLEEKDPVLYLWLLGQDEPEEIQLKELVKLIIHTYRHKS